MNRSINATAAFLNKMLVITFLSKKFFVYTCLPNRVLLAAFTIASISNLVISPTQIPIFEFNFEFDFAVTVSYFSESEALLTFTVLFLLPFQEGFRDLENENSFKNKFTLF